MRNFIILILFSASAAHGGFERTEAGGRALALAGAYTALGGDTWSVFYNPAGLARLSRPEAGFFLSPRPFGFSELAFMAAAAAIPANIGVVAVAGVRYGSSLYREESFGLSVGVPTALGDFGATLARRSVTIERYGSAAVYGLSAGYAIELERTLRMGFRVRDLNSPVIARSGERLRASAAMGIAYRPVPAFLASLELVKESAFDPSFRAGAEYVFDEAFAVRLGVADQPSAFHGGVGVRQGFASFDYAFSLHEDLGLTHECSISVRWGGGSGE